MRLPSTSSPLTNGNGCCSAEGLGEPEAKEDGASSARNPGVKDVHANPNMREVDYSEYEWMEHIEEFDKEVIRELEEQAFYEQCFMEASEDSEDGCCDLDDLDEYDEEEEEALGIVIMTSEVPFNNEQARSTPLNPSAPEFVPKSFSSNGDAKKG